MHLRDDLVHWQKKEDAVGECNLLARAKYVPVIFQRQQDDLRVLLTRMI
jgi:hypothetical protein